MVNTVNQCILSQADFDFINKANLLADVGEKLVFVESILKATLLFAGASTVAMIIILTVAFRIRRHDKKRSNFLFAIIPTGLMVIAALFYINYGKFELAQSEVAVLNKEIEAMDKPDAELFDACRQPNAIVELASNRDEPDFESSFESKIILD